MLLPLSGRLYRLKDSYPRFISFFLALAVVLPLLFLFDPCWQTNDDVGMSMMVHGYGAFVEGSPNLIFSNVVWGHFVRLLPHLFGMPGYSLATILVLFIITWAIILFLYQLDLGYLQGILAGTLIITQAVFLPQFTVNAGLLTVAAVTGFIVYSHKGDIVALIVSCGLAYCGFLVRSLEFLLVIAVAIPLVPWRLLLSHKQMRYALISLVAMIAASIAIDIAAYKGGEWNDFKAFNQVRIPLTDYGAAYHLQQRRDIIEKYGYSKNDLALIDNWFFFDPKINDAGFLKAMLEELGPVPMQGGGIEQGLTSLKALSRTVILPLIVPALLLAVIVHRRAVLVSFFIFLTAMFIFGVMGRPGIYRVYYPIVCLLLLSSLFLRQSPQKSYRRYMIILMLFAVCLANFVIVSDYADHNKSMVKKVKADLGRLTPRTLIAWGYSFPYEYAYPVLDTYPARRPLSLYSSWSLTRAPGSVSAADDFVARLLSDEGVFLAVGRIDLFATSAKQLAVYCDEHHKGYLQPFLDYAGSVITVYRLKCSK